MQGLHRPQSYDLSIKEFILRPTWTLNLKKNVYDTSN